MSKILGRFVAPPAGADVPIAHIILGGRVNGKTFEVQFVENGVPKRIRQINMDAERARSLGKLLEDLLKL